MTREPETTPKARNPSNAAANDRSPQTISQPAVQPLQPASVEKPPHEDAIVPAGRENIKPFQLQTNHTGLPDGLKSGIEQLSGISMDSVNVHYNSGEPAQLSAYAYARNNDIHIGPGQEQHLPHEAWHVVQQKQGRVQPEVQIKGNVPVNNDPGLEAEATQMGAKAMQMKAADETLAAPASRRSSGQVVQMVNYPQDTHGTIDHVMDKVPAKGGGTKDITGAELQTEILRLVTKAASKDSGGFRLGTYAFIPGGLKRIKDPNPEDHGMDALPKKFDVSSIDPLISPLVIGTMADAGQLAYLSQNWESINSTHDVVVDVDCQFNRNGEVGFHKDSRGTTVFFNLTFSNEAEMQGPEFYPDLIGAPDLEEKLPTVVQKDILERRGREKEMQREAGGFLADIQSPKLGPWGRVSLSDSNLYHTTPKMGHRNKAPLPPFDRQYYIETLTFLTKNEADYREYFTNQTNEQLYNWMITKSEQFNTHNSESTAMEGQQDKMRDETARRTRRLSLDLDEGKTDQKDLDKQKKTPRTFIRTWIRMFPKLSTATPMEDDNSLKKTSME